MLLLFIILALDCRIAFYQIKHDAIGARFLSVWNMMNEKFGINSKMIFMFSFGGPARWLSYWYL